MRIERFIVRGRATPTRAAGRLIVVVAGVAVVLGRGTTAAGTDATRRMVIVGLVVMGVMIVARRGGASVAIHIAMHDGTTTAGNAGRTGCIGRLGGTGFRSGLNVGDARLLEQWRGMLLHGQLKRGTGGTGATHHASPATATARRG